MFTNDIVLPQPMAYLTKNITSIEQNSNGFISFSSSPFYAGQVNGYNTDIDTRNGGANQNQVWVRVGNNASDLAVARNIIAGNGTIFNPQAFIVATWFEVDAFPQQAGLQNTFQLVMAYSATGETWVIFTYAQLKFYQTQTVPVALVELKDQNAVVVQRFNIINSNSTMAQLLNGICVIAFHVHFYSYDTTAQNLRYVLALV